MMKTNIEKYQLTAFILPCHGLSFIFKVRTVPMIVQHWICHNNLNGSKLSAVHRKIIIFKIVDSFLIQAEEFRT